METNNTKRTLKSTLYLRLYIFVNPSFTRSCHLHVPPIHHLSSLNPQHLSFLIHLPIFACFHLAKAPSSSAELFWEVNICALSKTDYAGLPACPLLWYKLLKHAAFPPWRLWRPFPQHQNIFHLLKQSNRALSWSTLNIFEPFDFAFSNTNTDK